MTVKENTLTVESQFDKELTTKIWQTSCKHIRSQNKCECIWKQVNRWTVN